MSPESPAQGEGGETNSSSEELIGRLWKENQQLGRTLRELRRGVDTHSIITITDRRGVILEANSKFVEISRYAHDEIVGAPQNLVNSGTHAKEFYRKLWRTIQNGEVWHGELCNRAKDGSLFWIDTTIVPLVDEAGVPERYMSIGTDVSQLRRTERRVRKLAFFDQLTELPNRAAIIKHLNEAAARPGDDVRAMLTIAFEDLPLVNDAFGYEMGDRMLRVVAEALGGLIEQRGQLSKAPSTVGRISSKNFALCFRGLGSTREEADARVREIVPYLVTRLDEVMKENLGTLFEANLRIGYVLYQAADRLEGEEIFARAQMAWRRAQPAPGSLEPVGFDEQMIAETNARVSRVFDMRRGIAQGEMALFLQPIVDASRAKVGLEALVRWQDPSRGLVMPDDFIPLAERTGLIIEIGTWVLDEACRILAGLGRDPSTEHLIMSVNVSELQLRTPCFVETVLDAVHRHGVRPERLKLEVTESMVHADFEHTVEKLERLRSEKIEIALDDFGEGYSSLSALRNLPVRLLKIDRSLVADVVEDRRCAAMVSTVVDMAHQLDLVVVAEGVETEEQFDVLQRFSVDNYQGYLFGRPAHVDPALTAA